MHPYLRAFLAGFAATLLFHQVVFAAFYLAGAAPVAPFNMTPTQPLGIPAVISLAFWGGVWGIPIWLLIRAASGAAYWTRAAIFGALGPSAVALFLVFPLKGGAFAAGWDPKIIIGALILNAAWGIGLALFMRWPKAA